MEEDATPHKDGIIAEGDTIDDDGMFAPGETVEGSSEVVREDEGNAIVTSGVSVGEDDPVNIVQVAVMDESIAQSEVTGLDESLITDIAVAEGEHLGVDDVVEANEIIPQAIDVGDGLPDLGNAVLPADSVGLEGTLDVGKAVVEGESAEGGEVHGSHEVPGLNEPGKEDGVMRPSEHTSEEELEAAGERHAFDAPAVRDDSGAAHGEVEEAVITEDDKSLVEHDAMVGSETVKADEVGMVGEASARQEERVEAEFLSPSKNTSSDQSRATGETIGGGDSAGAGDEVMEHNATGGRENSVERVDVIEDDGTIPGNASVASGGLASVGEDLDENEDFPDNHRIQSTKGVGRDEVVGLEERARVSANDDYTEADENDEAGEAIEADETVEKDEVAKANQTLASDDMVEADFVIGGGSGGLLDDKAVNGEAGEDNVLTWQDGSVVAGRWFGADDTIASGSGVAVDEGFQSSESREAGDALPRHPALEIGGSAEPGAKGESVEMTWRDSPVRDGRPYPTATADPFVTARSKDAITAGLAAVAGSAYPGESATSVAAALTRGGVTPAQGEHRTIRSWGGKRIRREPVGPADSQKVLDLAGLRARERRDSLQDADAAEGYFGREFGKVEDGIADVDDGPSLTEAGETKKNSKDDENLGSVGEAARSSNPSGGVDNAMERNRVHGDEMVDFNSRLDVEDKGTEYLGQLRESKKDRKGLKAVVGVMAGVAYYVGWAAVALVLG